MCLVLWTQAPLAAIVLLAFVVGAIWEIRNGIRIKKRRTTWQKIQRGSQVLSDGFFRVAGRRPLTNSELENNSQVLQQSILKIAPFCNF